MKKPPLILAIDDEKDMLETYQIIFKKRYSLLAINNALEGLTIIKNNNIFCVLLDIRMPGMDGLSALKKIREIDPDLPVIIITASRDLQTAVEAMKIGAIDFVVKPFENQELFKLIDKAIEKTRLIRENLYLKSALEEKTAFELLGQSPAMQKIFELIDASAATDSTVLITGESGTGKELIAAALHKQSRRKNMPFIAVNCAAIPDNLFESELFGHERGSFTGALDKKLGKFELAQDGTIFLDEIGCMSPALQAKLLRVLQEGEIERIGSGKPVAVDVRVICATNCDLIKMIKEKQFREDLYYRINVIPITVPPLRSRKEDIPLYLSYFLNRYNREMNKSIKGFTASAQDTLLSYPWPGNVRELQNLVERLAVLSSSDYIEKNELQLNIENPITRQSSFKAACDEFEKNYILTTLKENNYNQTITAKALGIHRTTLISKMVSLNLKKTWSD